MQLAFRLCFLQYHSNLLHNPLLQLYPQMSKLIYSSTHTERKTIHQKHNCIFYTFNIQNRVKFFYHLILQFINFLLILFIYISWILNNYPLLDSMLKWGRIEVWTIPSGEKEIIQFSKNFGYSLNLIPTSIRNLRSCCFLISTYQYTIRILSNWETNNRSPHFLHPVPYIPSIGNLIAIRTQPQ